MQNHLFEQLQAQKERRQRDPNLDNPSVMKHREIIHLRANYIQREIIAEEIWDVRIWEGVLVEWMAHGRNPKDVLGMIKAYKVIIDGMIGASR